MILRKTEESRRHECRPGNLCQALPRDEDRGSAISLKACSHQGSFLYFCYKWISIANAIHTCRLTASKNAHPS